MKNKEEYLLSKIPLRASLLTSMRSVKNTLSLFPGIRLLSHGTSLRYMINKDAKDYFYVLEISKEAIIFEIHSKQSPLGLMQDAILKILVIISFLKDKCKVSLDDLFPYLISAMAKEQIDYYNQKFQETDIDFENGFILAKRINSLKKENAELKAKVEKLESG